MLAAKYSGNEKKRETQVRSFQSSVASISFKLRENRYGSKEAIASSWSLTSEP